MWYCLSSSRCITSQMDQTLLISKWSYKSPFPCIGEALILTLMCDLQEACSCSIYFSNIFSTQDARVQFHFAMLKSHIMLKDWIKELYYLGKRNGRNDIKTKTSPINKKSIMDEKRSINSQTSSGKTARKFECRNCQKLEWEPQEWRIQAIYSVGIGNKTVY